MKTLAVLLYEMGKASYRMIAHLLGVSHIAVYSWIRTEAAKLPEPEMTGEMIVLSIYFINNLMYLSNYRMLTALALAISWRKANHYGLLECIPFGQWQLHCC